MWNWLRRWMNDIPLHDPIVRQQAALTQVILLGLIGIFAFAAVVTLLAPLLVASISLAQVLFSVVANGIAALLFAAPLSLLRRGYFRLTVIFLMIFFILLPAFIAVNQGLSDNVALLLSTIPITLAALVLGRRALLLTLRAAIAVVSIAAVWEQFVKPKFDARAIIINFTLITSVLALFLDRFGVILRHALDAALIRERELEVSRAALQARTHELEHEIAERRRVEAALRESEELYRLITENSSDLISLLDLDDAGQRVYASPSYRVVLGYSPGDLLGQQAAGLIHPDDVTTVVEQFGRIAVAGRVQATYRLRHADG